jgi:precorrin-6A/cobalt-precorrin-6A reductase
MTTPQRILILGGTHEARNIASLLLGAGHDVTTSLAGVTTSPILPHGKLRIGGFGGVNGLVDYLTVQSIDVLVDATHPFAAIMSNHAFEAAEITSCKLLRFERPAWQTEGLTAASLVEAAAMLPANAVVFITSGRKHLAPFFERRDLRGVVRTVEPIVDDVPANWTVILDRPPQTLQGEITLMQGHGISHLITKNAGGSHTRTKLDSARMLGLTVIMIARPLKPKCETYSTVEDLAKRLGTAIESR